MKRTLVGAGIAGAVAVALTVPPALAERGTTTSARHTATKSTATTSSDANATTKKPGKPKKCPYPPGYTKMTMTPSASKIKKRGQVTMHGNMSQNGCKLGHKKMQVNDASTDKAVGFGTTDDAGYYAVKVFVSQTTSYYARFLGDSTSLPGRSPTVTVTVGDR